MSHIIITESKKDKMSELVEDMLLAGGKLMHCLEELEDEDGYGERRYSRRYGMRDGGRYGMRYGMRDEDWDDMDYMNERRYRRRY